MRNIHWLAAVLTIAFLASSASADIAPPLQFGQSLAPNEATKVAMTAEEVTITLLPERALVRAVFHLENTGVAEELLVGFPNTAPGAVYGSMNTPMATIGVRLRDFHARVDGQSVRHRNRVPVEREVPLETEPTPAPEFQPLEGWITWDMAFAAAQQRTVEVTYWVPYRPRYRSTLLGDRDLTYVLKTGAAWHGPIGKATLIVRCGEGVTREHVADIKLPGFVEKDGELVWNLTDLVPDQDLILSVRRSATYDDAARFYLAHAKKYTEEGNAHFAAQCQAAATECLWRAKSYESCLSTCRQVIAYEQAMEAPSSREGFHIKSSYRAPRRVWERFVIRCLVKLGRQSEARAEAPAAIAAMRADLAERKSYRHPDLEEFEARIARYEAFATGGKFED